MEKSRKTAVFKGNLFLSYFKSHRCSVLNIMGDESPHDDDVIDTNGRLDPTKSAFIKVGTN